MNSPRLLRLQLATYCFRKTRATISTNRRFFSKRCVNPSVSNPPSSDSVCQLALFCTLPRTWLLQRPSCPAYNHTTPTCSLYPINTSPIPYSITPLYPKNRSPIACCDGSAPSMLSPATPSEVNSRRHKTEGIRCSAKRGRMLPERDVSIL